MSEGLQNTHLTADLSEFNIEGITLPQYLNSYMDSVRSLFHVWSIL